MRKWERLIVERLKGCIRRRRMPKCNAKHGLSVLPRDYQVV